MLPAVQKMLFDGRVKLKRDRVGHAVRQLPFGLGLASLKLVALGFQFAEPLDEQLVVEAA